MLFEKKIDENGFSNVSTPTENKLQNQEIETQIGLILSSEIKS